MGAVRVLDSYSAKQIPNPTGPAMGPRIIGEAVKDLGGLLADEFSGLPEDKGRIFSEYWRTVRENDLAVRLNPFALFIRAISGHPIEAVHCADIRVKRHWYSPSKVVLTVLGREWEDSVFIGAPSPELLSFIKRAADKFVTRQGVPDVHIYALGPEFLPQPPPAYRSASA